MRLVKRPASRRAVTTVERRKLDIRRDGGLVVATVTAHSILLPGITIRADTVSAIEPTG